MKILKAFFASLVLLALSLLPIATAQADTNLVANPSFETASANLPTGWSKGNWGANTAAFTYEATGHTGSHSATVKLSNYTSGDAKWYFAPVTVTPGTTYTFSDWYKSTGASEVDAVVTTTSGTTKYYWVSNPAVSTDWKQTTSTFTAPSNAKAITFYHSIYANGSLTTDDFSLSAPVVTPPTAPTVSITAPANNATVSGTTSVTANAGDVLGVSSVQFKLDGVNLGTADTTAPYSTSWNTANATNGSHTLTAVATNTSNLTTTSSSVAVTVNNTVVTPPAPTAPTVSLTAPAANATVAGTTNVTATASDAIAVTSVQFKVDGVNLGAADTTAPYTIAWDTKTVANGVHTIAATAVNGANLSTTTTETVTVNNPTPPVVALTAPVANATVSGSVNIAATATDTVAVSSVQFKLDGVNLGAAVTVAPYTYAWDTSAVANGSHTLTAVATNGANLSTTAASVTVNVSNVVITPPSNPTNLILNPSVETATNGLPNNWHSSAWGTNTASNTYENTGRTGSQSLKTTITSYSNGDAKWYFDPIAVTPGQNYEYSNWYQSSVDTEVDAQVTAADGSVSYYYIGTAPASSSWAQVKAQFTAPANAQSVTIFQVINKVGYIQTDDFSFGPYAPSGFNRPIVSLTFDDGWRNQYTNGLPLLNQYNMHATFYVISDVAGDSGYMTTAMMQTLKNAGNEIADHTVTHPHLPTLTVAQIDAEMGDSQVALRSWFGATGVASNFATPYGEYNDTVITEAKKYFRSHRSTDSGYNSKDNFNIYDIKVQNVNDATTPAQVAAWVAQAQTDKTWLVLVYHMVAADPHASQEDYSVTPANLQAELAQMQSNGIAVETVDQALDEIVPQL